MGMASSPHQLGHPLRKGGVGICEEVDTGFAIDTGTERRGDVSELTVGISLCTKQAACM